MSSKDVVLIATKEEKKFNVENDILQYLCSQLINLKFIIKETCKIESNSEYLIKKIQNYLETSVIYLLISQNELVYKALAKLFDEKLIVSKHLASLYNINTSDDQNVKEISVPCNSKIFQIQNHVNGINPVCIQFKNIFILPNDINSVKVIFENILLPLFTEELNNEIFGKHFVLNCNQNGISNMVNDKLSGFSDSVNVSRYCVVKSGDNCELHVKIKSKNLFKLIECENVFKTIVSSNLIMSQGIDDSCWERFHILKEQPCVEDALKVIKTCYKDYQPQDIFLCFNGGKDCTVVLFLTLFVLKTIYPLYNEPLLCLYIQSNDPFEEVEEYIENMRIFGNLNIIKTKAGVKEGLRHLLNERTHLVAALMGTRKTDPYSAHLNHFSMTDPDWPAIMRVFPILNWTFNNVWSLLLTCKIPYCSLYEHGYTSVGDKSTTIPHPDLEYEEDGVVKYLPAYKLKDESQERKNRVRKKSCKKSTNIV